MEGVGLWRLLFRPQEKTASLGGGFPASRGDEPVCYASREDDLFEMGLFAQE